MVKVYEINLGDKQVNYYISDDSVLANFLKNLLFFVIILGCFYVNYAYIGNNGWVSFALFLFIFFSGLHKHMSKEIDLKELKRIVKELK